MWGPQGWRAGNVALFFPSPAANFVLSSLSWSLLVELSPTSTQSKRLGPLDHCAKPQRPVGHLNSHSTTPEKLKRTLREKHDILGGPAEADSDGDVITPIDLENACGRAFCSTCLEAARLAFPPLAATSAAQYESCDTGSDAMTDGLPTPPCEAVGRAPNQCS